MPVDTSEDRFERDIVERLTAPLTGAGGVADPPVPYGAAPGGYLLRTSADYDRARCLLPTDAVAFVQATQPEQWNKLRRATEDPEAIFLKELGRVATKRGTLSVLRDGFKVRGAAFRMAFFRPATGLNPDLARQYQANQFAVVQQLRYSQTSAAELDLALFLNGLPLFTAELKTPLKGQTWRNAVRQYRQDRDPAEPLFALGRCLAHWAVDPDEAHFTTHLRGEPTRFFPFNRGFDGGAGNPPSASGYATAYLWAETWARDSVLDLVQHVVHQIDVLDDDGEPTGEQALVFPRYHQLDAVRRLVADTRAHGPGKRYLVQHSAGSGKSFTIGWLAHRLTSLHDADDRRVFDAVIVVTDRRILDKQLGQTIGQLERTRGLVATVADSRELRQAIEGGKQIVVSTIQKFPEISDAIAADAGRRYAVLVDEAHSSQSGDLRRHLNTVLEAGSLDEAAQKDEQTGDDLEDTIAKAMSTRGHLPNVSTFAFTATPKPTTRELFGTRDGDGRYHAFSLYSMRQAIDEGFIEDVLQNYVTYRHHFALLKTAAEDPQVDQASASRLLREYVTEHPDTIARKARIIAAHFHGEVAHGVAGKAKAMVVTRSRLHAVRMAGALRDALREVGAIDPATGSPYGVLTAFSGTVHDPEQTDATTGRPLDLTETSINGFPESQTAKTFARAAFRFLVVASKYQTGFDEPLLAAMYVDKPLRGVGAVQTLSRLNRIHADKDGTVVLDFANTPEEIAHAFQDYYDRAVLTSGTDPSALYDLEHELSAAGLYTEDEVEAFAEVWYGGEGTQAQVHALLRPAEDRYKAVPEDDQQAFRRALGAYVRLYGYLAQTLTFTDTSLEKLYTFGAHLFARLPGVRPRELPPEVLRLVDLGRSRISRSTDGAIELAAESTSVDPQPTPTGRPAPGSAPLSLSDIIGLLNERFGMDLTEDDVVFIGRIEERLAQSEAVRSSFQVNPPDKARLTFDEAAQTEVQKLFDDNYKLYTRLNKNKAFADALLTLLFDRYQGGTTGAGPAAAP